MKPEKKKICHVGDGVCEYVSCGVWCNNYNKKLSDVGENRMYDKFIEHLDDNKLDEKTIKTLVDDIEKDLCLHDYSEWYTFKESMKNYIQKAISKKLDKL